MRILDVSPRVNVPLERGSGVRMHNLLRHLAARHEVRQFSQQRWLGGRAARGLQEVRIGDRYSEWNYTDAAACLLTEVSERAWIRAPVLSGAALHLRRPSLLIEFLRWANVVIVEFPWQFDFCRRVVPDGRVVLAAHNVEALKFPEYAQAAKRHCPTGRGSWIGYIERAEARAVSGANLTLAVSDDDRDVFVRRYGADPSRVVVIPNGADTEIFRPTGVEERRAARRELRLPERTTLFFNGSDVPPNRDGLEWFCRLASRTNRFSFVAAGPVTRNGQSSGALLMGPVPDMAPYFRAADLFLCPIRFGGGTKIKLLEAMAAGLPTVVSPESTHGLAVRDGEHLLVAGRSEEEWLTAIAAIVDDEELANRLGAAAADFVRQHHDWKQIADTLDGALSQLVSRGESVASGLPAASRKSDRTAE